MMNKIKNQISPLLLNFLVKILRPLKLLRLNRENNLSVLILPPADAGSLGDEAMISGTIDFYKERGAKYIDLISFAPISEVEYSYEVCPNIRTVEFKNYFHFALLIFRYTEFCCLGADMMDGYYSDGGTIHRLNLASIASRIGIKSSILGFSFNNQPTANTVESFKSLPKKVRLCARDPISYERLVKHTQRDIKLVADLAFLLRPNDTSSFVIKASDWINSRKADGNIVVGINANFRLTDNSEDRNFRDLAKTYVDALVEVHSQIKKVSFVLIPHDFRNLEGEISDVEFVQIIWDSLPRELKSNCLKLDELFSSAEVKSICGKLDVVLSGRMHLAIACFGQGTPPACIVYQGKFEGLFKHFELDGLTIEPSEAKQPHKLSQFLISLIERHEVTRHHIGLKLPEIQKLARFNFE